MRRGRARRPLIVGCYPLVCGGKNLRLHQLHRLTTALHTTVAGLDAQDFRPAALALKPLTQLVRHSKSLPGIPAYCFCCIASPQQASAPSPPFVTIISVPHLVHWYRFPTWFAKNELSSSSSVGSHWSPARNIPDVSRDSQQEPTAHQRRSGRPSTSDENHSGTCTTRPRGARTSTRPRRRARSRAAR